MRPLAPANTQLSTIYIDREICIYIHIYIYTQKNRPSNIEIYIYIYTLRTAQLKTYLEIGFSVCQAVPLDHTHLNLSPSDLA